MMVILIMIKITTDELSDGNCLAIILGYNEHGSKILSSRPLVLCTLYIL